MTTIDVLPADDGERLDVFLTKKLEGASRRRVTRLIESGRVRVDGRRARKGTRLAAGQRVSLEALPEPADFDPVPAPELPLPILYEDAHVVIADKPAGMPSHPLRPDERGTAANLLVARYPEMAGVGRARREAGLVQRLDTGTSGALLAARDRETFVALAAALESGRIDKAYVALARGDVPVGLAMDAQLASDPKNARRVVATGRGDPSRTTRVIASERCGAFSLVTVRAARAGRHQVRAHLACTGHPLAGDALYGGPSLPGLSRHFLHASSIALDRPDGRGRLAVESPLPSDLAGLLDTIRGGA